jgi:uncharacterized protein (DUF433 family)
MDLIECNKNKCFGEPSLVGKRLTVRDVVSKLRVEDGMEVALEDYDITREQAKAAVEYCRIRKCQSDQSLLRYCDGCVLRTLQDKELFNPDEYREVMLEDGSMATVSLDGKQTFLGTKKQMEEKFMGRAVWQDAEKIWPAFAQKGLRRGKNMRYKKY